MTKLLLKRSFENQYGTFGSLLQWHQDTKQYLWLCQTLELPWKDNQEDISCIPEGMYNVRKSVSDGKFVFRFDNVKGRTGILIHTANWIRELKGCIAVGMSYGDTGLIDSASAMRRLKANLPDVFTLEVKKCRI